MANTFRGNDFASLISNIKQNKSYADSLNPKSQPTGSNNFLGSNFDYLQNNLKQSAEGNDPLFDQLFGNASRRIGASTDRNIQDIKEAGAQSGFRGAGGNLINDAYKGEKESLGQVSDELAGRELQYKQNAIAQLLGLNQFEGGQNFDAFQSDRQNSQFNQSQAQEWEMFNKNLQYQKDMEPAWWESLLGGLIGGAAQVGSAALLASDKKLKKNIKKVAETEEGIPVVKFNYKEGGKAEHIGFLSKDVKKKHPEAVVEAVDYTKIPMKISKLLAA